MASGVFTSHLANNYVNDKGGIEESLISGGDTGVGQAPPSAYGQVSGQGLSPGMQESYDRITGKMPKVSIPQPDVMQEHDRRRADVFDKQVGELEKKVAELEKQQDKSFLGELNKKMPEIIGGGLIGSLRGGAWGALGGAVIGAATESSKRTNDPLEELPEMSNGLGRHIP